MKSRFKLINGIGLFAFLLTGCCTGRCSCSNKVDFPELIVTFDTHGGNAISSQNVKYAGKVTKPEDPTRLGYDFVGWTYKGEEWSFIGYSVTEDMTLDANWNIITYNITYDLNGGSLETDNPSTYTVEDAIELNNPVKTGYIFTGWTSNGSSIASIPAGSTGDLALTANWQLGSFKVDVIVSDTSLGSVTGQGTYDFGSSITLTASPTIDNVFKGWYADSALTTLLSVDNPYTFNLESEGMTIYAKFLTKAWNTAHGVIPSLSEDGKTMTYGLYPQTYVSDTLLISSLNALMAEANGWYFYNDEYYAKLTATPYSSASRFSDGTTIESHTEYWFRCEPITWNVLSNDDGKYYILSNVQLDTHLYNDNYYGEVDGHYANNYEYSEMRSWLNDDFYKAAFALDNSHILTSTVDNSAATTNATSNPYAGHSTEDKIFLPSYQDYINTEYGFPSSADGTASRYCKSTDWARAKGAYHTASSGWYWTRSPSSSNPNHMWYIDSDGYLHSDIVNLDDIFLGVRPAMVVSSIN